MTVLKICNGAIIHEQMNEASVTELLGSKCYIFRISGALVICRKSDRAEHKPNNALGNRLILNMEQNTPADYPDKPLLREAAYRKNGNIDDVIVVGVSFYGTEERDFHDISWAVESRIEKFCGGKISADEDIA